MNIKDRLARVFKETFLDLFEHEAPSPDNMESALTQARSSVEDATDALATFMVVDLQLQEKRGTLHDQIEALTLKLESALKTKNDDQARTLIRDRQYLQKQVQLVDEQADASAAKKSALKKQLDAMKTRVLEIERKKLDLELRDRAAEAIDEINRAGTDVIQAHDCAKNPELERDTLKKEAVNQLTEEHQNTLTSRVDNLLEEDEIEQELARLKQLRNTP